MSTVRTTVTDALIDQHLQSYIPAAEPVVVALERREDEIKAGLREFAEQRGLTRREVTELFIHVGLEPEPEPEPTPVQAQVPTTDGDEADLIAKVDRLAGLLEDLTGVVRAQSDQIGSLQQAARSRGLSV